MSRQVDIKALVSHIVRGDGSDRCRICMGDTTEGQVHLEDTVMMDGDKPVTLAELLAVITGVEMKEESLIPVGACVACASTALAAQEFRLFVRNSEKLWCKALVNLGTLPLSAAPPVKSVCAFIKTDLSMQTFKDYNTSDPKTILNRLKNRVAKKTVDRKPRGARTGPSCSCPDCGKGFLSPYYLNMHLRNSGHKEACLICGSVFVRGKEMQDHLSSVHNETVFLCKKCPILFPNESQLKKHMKKAHRAGALTCTDCGRTFPRNASFDTHSQMHAVRTCRACGVQFTNRGCYREHRSQCEPDAKPNAQNMPRNRRSNIRDPATFTCDHCGKTYNSRPQLKNHILWIHMDIRPHQCQWCGKRFYTPARLAEHTVVHTRVRNFECDICGAKLVSKMAAVYHRRRHTGERPYECEDCDKAYLEKTLIACKGSVEKAKKQIDYICTARTLLPRFFTKTNVKLELQSVLELAWMVPMPRLTEDYHRILIIKINPKKFTSDSFMEYFRYNIILTEYIKANDYFNGMIAIDDYRELNLMEVISKMNTNELRQLVSILINGYGARLKSIHILTDSSTVDLLIKIVKQFVSEKIGNRFHVQRTLEDLHKVVPKELLPVEYGGNEKSIATLQEEWIEELSSKKHVEYMKMMNKASSDETKRHEGKFNEEYMGVPGSFRCLKVD